jgi:hypothetical protein
LARHPGITGLTVFMQDTEAFLGTILDYHKIEEES